MRIKIINKHNVSIPKYATKDSVGVDLHANLKKDIVLNPNERILISTGIYIKLPKNVEAQIRPRSGLTLKHGIAVLNSPGTIDSDYVDEIGVILINLSAKSYTIKNGDRIAQMVFNKIKKIKFKKVYKLKKTSRIGGFGSTGK